MSETPFNIDALLGHLEVETKTEIVGREMRLMGRSISVDRHGNRTPSEWWSTSVMRFPEPSRIDRLLAWITGGNADAVFCACAAKALLTDSQRA